MESLLTVVMATVGEPSLKRTIESLFNSSVVPDKILICIPKKNQKNLPSLVEFGNVVEIIPTNENGQVIQRIIGFRASTSKYTLQLDSDIVLEKDCLEILISFLEINNNAAVAPQIFDIETSEHHSYLNPHSSKFSRLDLRLLHFLANGYDGFKPGIISKCGENFGTIEGEGPTKCEWLPGCCILHRNKNLVLENFYPFKGKAYSEDVIHSHILRNRNIELYELPNAKAQVFFPSNWNLKISEIAFVQFKAFKMKFYTAKILGKSRLRLLLYTSAYQLLLLKRKVFGHD